MSADPLALFAVSEGTFTRRTSGFSGFLAARFISKTIGLIRFLSLVADISRLEQLYRQREDKSFVIQRRVNKTLLVGDHTVQRRISPFHYRRICPSIKFAELNSYREPKAPEIESLYVSFFFKMLQGEQNEKTLPGP